MSNIISNIIKEVPKQIIEMEKQLKNIPSVRSVEALYAGGIRNAGFCYHKDVKAKLCE